MSAPLIQSQSSIASTTFTQQINAQTAETSADETDGMSLDNFAFQEFTKVTVTKDTNLPAFLEEIKECNCSAVFLSDAHRFSQLQNAVDYDSDDTIEIGRLVNRSELDNIHDQKIYSQSFSHGVRALYLIMTKDSAVEKVSRAMVNCLIKDGESKLTESYFSRNDMYAKRGENGDILRAAPMNVHPAMSRKGANASQIRKMGVLL